jgi:hypothetical protein
MACKKDIYSSLFNDFSFDSLIFLLPAIYQLDGSSCDTQLADQAQDEELCSTFKAAATEAVSCDGLKPRK